MEFFIIAVFVLGYAAIALEHPIKIDKAASALLTGVLTWSIFMLYNSGVGEHLRTEFEHFTQIHGASGSHALTEFFGERLLHHVSEIASILFFLMGAMTIVELVDAHEGFSVITDRIKTTNKVKLLWIVGVISFFLSAALDNLTTTIVMISLLRKLVDDQHTRWFYAGIVVIAANAGGAWSPIGDVTTTMLWIKGQLPDVPSMITTLFIPSLVVLVVPLLLLTAIMKGDVKRPLKAEGPEHYLNPTTSFERNLVFALGLGGLLFVPIFKTVTHLPPFMGMMMSLSILWIVTELIHRSKNREVKHDLSVIGVLRKIDVASVLFFLGILLAVASLQEAGLLNQLAMWLDQNIGNLYAINVTIGLLSSIVDNVPLVAAAQGMYTITTPEMLEGAADAARLAEFLPNGHFWQFLAYCAGTGGSVLIIGSAAGVAAMGLERIDFIWYLKRISGLALLGYAAGALTYILIF